MSGQRTSTRTAPSAAKERAEQLIEKAKDQRELELAQARLKRALTRLQVTAK